LGGYPGGFYSGPSVPPPVYYQGFANPALGYANSLGYSRFGVNDMYSGSYAGGNVSPVYGGYSPYYGNNGGMGLNPSTATGPSGNYAPTYYGNASAPQAYNNGMGAENVPGGPGVGNLGYPNPVTPGAYPAAGSYGPI
jgi:hypothetical protein